MKGAIIVPYRDREDHLRAFIPHMTKYLNANDYDLPIFIMQQIPGKPFNRAKLFNVAVWLIINSNYKIDYFIFHDVDMLPILAYYGYPQIPTHIATRCSQFGYKMPDPNYFGGVTLVNKAHFLKVNGFSNDFWGWGYEDEEFRERFVKMNIRIGRRQCTFESFDHPRPVHWTQYYKLKKEGKPLPPEYIQYEQNKSMHKTPDISKGLSTVDYKVINTESTIPNVNMVTVEI